MGHNTNLVHCRRRSWWTGWDGPDPVKICTRGQSMFWPQNFTFFHSKLLLDNSASFTSSTTKDLSQKRKVKLIFEAPERLWRLDLTDHDPHPLILQKIYATADIRASGVARGGVVGAAAPLAKNPELHCILQLQYWSKGSIRSIVGKWNIWVMRCGSFTSGNTQTPTADSTLQGLHSQTIWCE